MHSQHLTTSVLYRTGTLDLVCANVNWAGNGYRLPTEAESEKACRGGLTGQFYAWDNQAPLTRANHWQYLVSVGREQEGYHISTQVGYFNSTTDSANAYGLYDMNGNA